ncbi:hypothetical protein K457DRAFT_729194 [Linnemannia elongata AG-77]|uniref:Uncharacterized protein n=1 Tax=Linnemannia elongata AG-77 TaxID=1314771 RepID=A0A197JLJ9_9FUNG|nr:hypothetical protein K457DRAFT_729194 [Linnemannia elongata AG-77]
MNKVQKIALFPYLYIAVAESIYFFLTTSLLSIKRKAQRTVCFFCPAGPHQTFFSSFYDGHKRANKGEGVTKQRKKKGISISHLTVTD